MRRFSYPSDIGKRLQDQRRARNRFWFVFFFIISVLALVVDKYLLAVTVVSGFVIVYLIFELHMHRIAKFTVNTSGNVIDVDDQFIYQKDHNGILHAKVARYPLPKTRYQFHVFGNAIYSVSGRDFHRGQETVRFSTYINGAQELVCNILGQEEWPPGSKETA